MSRWALDASLVDIRAERGERQRDMRLNRRTLALGAMLAALAVVGLGGTAQAAFPNFAGCVARDFENELCIHVQNRSATFDIKGFSVPLGESLEIRGTVVGNGTQIATFIPPRGTNGFFATPVPVPGGLLGIEWIPGNSVLAITELAGPASAIQINLNTNEIRLPVKVRLVNLLLGMNCHIGTDRSPVVLNLQTGTTNPPPPNRPISGRRGTTSITERGFLVSGNVNVDNSFAVPGASSCGLGLGLINSLVNLRLGLPSAAGNNSIVVNNDVALGIP